MLQFITNETDIYSHLEGAIQALRGGCKWIQLRMKKSSKDEIVSVAKELKIECEKYNAILIINDYPDIAIEVKADGVHLGKNDMSPIDARNFMGEEYIIGGTANCFEDIQRLVEANVDYIGLGPYRYTNTKENLSPILGLKGYNSIIKKCRDNNLITPIVSIGGIKADDISELIKSGVDGIAISGDIINANNPADKTKKIINEIFKSKK